MTIATLLRSQEGSATVTAAGIAGAIVMVTLVIIYIATTTIDSHHAKVAAELAAVARAEALSRGEQACQVAGVTASYNNATMITCDIAGGDVIVAAKTTTSTAKARAGPI